MKELSTIFITLLLTVSTLSAAAQPESTVSTSQLSGISQVYRRGTLRRNFMLRRAGEQDKGPGGNYFTGEKRQLTVLAAFADQDFLDDSLATLNIWDSIFNAEQLQLPPLAGSVHKYFSDQSYGQFNLKFDLQFVRLAKRERYRSTVVDDENSQYLISDVVDSLLKRDIDWSLYDWNGDGYINQVLIICAGKASYHGGFSNNRADTAAIWPHQWWLSQHCKDGQSNVFCEPRTVTCNDRSYIVDSYCAVQEIWIDNSYGAFGTICHEYTHCFGFPDVYTSSGTNVVNQWDLMDAGCYNHGGFYPAAYSAHERWLMGWLTPVELTMPTEVADMPALVDEPVAYLIRNDGYSDEYYILENRQKKGWDVYLPDSGLVIFHIDYDPDLWLSGPVNTLGTKHYTIIPANNKTSALSTDGWAYPKDIVNALTDTSAPAAVLWHANTDGEKLMSKPVTDIEMTDGLVAFKFMSPTTGIEPATEGARAQKFFRNGQILILRDNKIYTLQGLELR